MTSTSKRTIQKLIKRIATGEFGQSFRVVKSKNDRGDYGVSETYFAGALALCEISFDGARHDTRYGINPNLL